MSAHIKTLAERIKPNAWLTPGETGNILAASMAEVAELRAALASQGVAMPAGYALVPLEPTDEMLSAAWNGGALGGQDDHEECYSLMISAAPQPPAVKEAEPDYSACCDTPHLCSAVRRCTAKDAIR